MTKTPDLLCACATARQLARVLTQLYDSRLRESGLEAPQFALLMTMEQMGPCSQAELGRRFAFDKTTVSRNLRVLERNGWIEESAAEDKRKRQFTLTPAGGKRLVAAKPEWKRAQSQLRSSMRADEWDAMFQVFKIATDAAQKLSRGASRAC